jgi:hypothetical protein
MASVTATSSSAREVRADSNGKIAKQAAGYIYRPETEYVCGQCVALKPLSVSGSKTGCAWFGANEPVSDTSGTCIFFAHAAPYQLPWLGLFTKIELGYTENAAGFSCKRCEHFDLKGDCSKVDKDSPGDTPGLISANACCNIWEADKKRAKMDRERLLRIIK